MHRRADSRQNENRGGVEVSVPIVGGGFKVGKSGAYCNAIVRVIDGKAVEVNYTGDNDGVVGKEGVCAPTRKTRTSEPPTRRIEAEPAD